MKTTQKIAALGLLAALASSAIAIIPGIPTSSWPFVGKFGNLQQFETSAVPIGDKWLLTARHASWMNVNEARFQMDGGPILTSVNIIRHPTDDIAIVELDGILPGWYPYNTMSNEVGVGVELLGYGIKGIFQNGNWEFDWGTYGTKRRGTNNVSLAQYIDFGNGLKGNWLISDFDGNGINSFSDSGPTTDESTFGSGDSGGPSFMLQGGEWKVAGVHSWIGNVSGGPQPPRYGSIYGDVRISSYVAFIEATVPIHLWANSFTVTRGVPQSGGLSELRYSDDMYVLVQQRPPFSAADPSVQIVFETTSPEQNPSQLAFHVESAANGMPSGNLPQRIELFNFDSNNYELVDDRPSTTSDSVVEVTISSNAQRFVQNGTGLMRARISFFDRGVAFPNWAGRVDRAYWKAKRP